MNSQRGFRARFLMRINALIELLKYLILPLLQPASVSILSQLGFSRSSYGVVELSGMLVRAFVPPARTMQQVLGFAAKFYPPV